MVPLIDNSWIELQNWIERFNEPTVSNQTAIYVHRVLRKAIYELENIWFHSKIEPWLIHYYREYNMSCIVQLTLYWILFTQQRL